MASIFERQPLRPSQLRAVAERRFGDAAALCNTNDNERANGAEYLCGFVIEILFKAKLLEVHKPGAVASGTEEMIQRLIRRSHDLTQMLNQLPQLEAAVTAAGARSGKPLIRWLKELCATWTVYARYSPASTTIADARAMLERVRSLKEVLK